MARKKIKYYSFEIEKGEGDYSNAGVLKRIVERLSKSDFQQDTHYMPRDDHSDIVKVDYVDSDKIYGRVTRDITNTPPSAIDKKDNIKSIPLESGSRLITFTYFAIYGRIMAFVHTTGAPPPSVIANYCKYKKIGNILSTPIYNENAEEFLRKLLEVSSFTYSTLPKDDQTGEQFQYGAKFKKVVRTLPLKTKQDKKKFAHGLKHDVNFLEALNEGFYQKVMLSGKDSSGSSFSNHNLLHPHFSSEIEFTFFSNKDSVYEELKRHLSGDPMQYLQSRLYVK